MLSYESHVYDSILFYFDLLLHIVTHLAKLREYSNVKTNMLLQILFTYLFVYFAVFTSTNSNSYFCSLFNSFTESRWIMRS